MNFQDVLQQVGLDERESAVYLALLKDGPATVAELARRTGVHRPAIYQTLARAVPRGIVERVVRKKRFRYAAASPERLLELFEHARSAFAEVLPELRALHETAPNRPTVRYLEGVRGIQSVFADVVRKSKPGGVFFRYSSRKDTTSGDKYLPAHYKTERDHKHLERFVITSTAIAKGQRPRLERMTKVVPSDVDLFAYDITQVIFDDSVAFVDYHTETAFVIESPTIARFQERIFRLLFDRL